MLLKLLNLTLKPIPRDDTLHLINFGPEAFVLTKVDDKNKTLHCLKYKIIS